MQKGEVKGINTRKVLLTFVAVAAIIAITVFMTWDRIVIYFVAKQYGLTISYSNVKNMSFKELDFDNLKAIENRHGVGVFAEHAKLWPAIGVQAENSRSLSFELKGVKFIPSQKIGKKATNDYMLDLVGMPFNGTWGYKEIYGEVSEHEKGIYIRKLVASGDKMSLSANGYMFKNNMIDANITIFFSSSLLKELPESVTGTVLKDEPGQRKSFSAHLTGDLSAPSIELSGKLFRLNIKQINQ